MLNILKLSYNILKNNLIFIQPLLLFLLIFMTALSYVFNKNMFFIPKIVLGISIILLLIAFSAGWFYIIKNGIVSYNSDDDKEIAAIKTVQNFRKFFEGVGSGFIKTLGAYVIIAVIYTAVMYACVKLCLHLWGMPDFVYDLQKMTQSASQAELFNLINSVSDKDKLIFSAWVLLINGVGSILNFLVILYFAVIQFSECNIFKSVWLVIKFCFKNLLEIIFILFFIFCLYFMLNILSLIFGSGVFGLFILIVLVCLYLNYYVNLVFCFYNERTKDNSSNRTEFIG